MCGTLEPELRVLHHQGGSFGGKFRFLDRSAELQVSVVANYRLMVWQHCTQLGEVIGWLLGEAGYAALLARAHGPHGLWLYASSWRCSWRRARSLRSLRGGRLRPEFHVLS